MDMLGRVSERQDNRAGINVKGADINVKRDYLEFLKYICGRKSHGKGGFRRWEETAGVKKDEWGWAVDLGECDLVDCIRSEGRQRKMLVWEIGLFNRLNFWSET